MNCLGGTDAEMSIAVENLPLHWKKKLPRHDGL
jgi:hypothetical protein